MSSDCEGATGNAPGEKEEASGKRKERKKAFLPLRFIRCTILEHKTTARSENYSMVNNLIHGYLVNKHFQTAGTSTDNGRGREILL